MPQAAPHAERSSEWYDEKLKDERVPSSDDACTRELRKAGREVVDQNHALEVKLAEAAGVSQELADLQDKVDAAYKETAHWKKQFTDLIPQGGGPGREAGEAARRGHPAGRLPGRGTDGRSSTALATSMKALRASRTAYPWLSSASTSWHSPTTSMSPSATTPWPS